MAQYKKPKQEVQQEEVEMIELSEELEQIEEQLGQLDKQHEAAMLSLLGETEAKKAPLYEKRRIELRKIPNFWAICLSQHELIASIISDEDAAVLRTLKDVHVVRDTKSAATYTITFTFDDSNLFLVSKEIAVKVTGSEDSIAVQVVKPVVWQEGKSLFDSVGDSAKKGKKRTSEYHGFFTLFVDPDEEVATVLNYIANEIYPHASVLYMNALDADEEDDEEEEDEDEEDEDEEKQQNADNNNGTTHTSNKSGNKSAVKNGNKKTQ